MRVYPPFHHDDPYLCALTGHSFAAALHGRPAVVLTDPIGEE